jgi:hypothetical protein
MMASAQLLQGLMKWLARDEWRGQFANVLDDHLLPACRRTGHDTEEVVAILGKDWFMTTVWGCAFEDFLTREYAGGRNIVDEYLKRRGWKDSASARAYMSGLRRSVISLYEVTDIVRDSSFLARDLVRGGNPIRISERRATHSLRQWDHIATRIVTMGSQAVMSGAVLPYDRETSDKALKLIRNVRKRSSKQKQQLADLLGRDVNDPAIANAFSEDEVLRVAAPAITTLWLIDMIDRATTSPALEVRNSDGDELLFCTAHYPFVAGVTADAIRRALDRCPELYQENPTFWNWLGPRRPASGLRQSAVKSQSFITTLNDGSLVLGSVELQHQTVVLSVNSRARSERGRALLSKALDGLVAQPLIEIQTLEQARATRDPAPAPSLDLSEDDRRTIIKDTLDRHYRDLLDQPIPALGNRSPRAAVRTAGGRVKVVDWLKTLENHSTRLDSHNHEIASYNFHWLWRELGVDEFRQ